MQWNAALSSVRSGLKRVNAVRWNRGVNAIFHAGTDMGTIENCGVYLLQFNNFERLGGSQSTNPGAFRAVGKLPRMVTEVVVTLS
jgi:hypothetical protein